MARSMVAPRSLSSRMAPLLLITALLLPDSQEDLMAQIQTVSTTGTVSISTDTGILRTNLSTTCGSIRIFIHEFPVMYGAWHNPCDERLIGRPLYDVTMDAVGQAVLDSTRRYEAAALVLETCGPRTCVNLQDGLQRTWRATLRSFIIGQVYFVGSLAQSVVVGVLDLAILEGTPISNASLLFSRTCQVDDGHFFGSVELGSSHRTVKSRLELRNVTMMPILLVKYEERWACAKVRTIPPEEAVAQIGMRGISGTFIFRQESPFHPTHISMNLSNLRGHAAHYGIHVLPVLPRQEPGQDICTGANTGELWNPLAVSSQSTAAQTGHSSWPLGDLSGRHGTLQGAETFLSELMDWNLPLFGNNSIVWRSVVIYNTSGEPWACSTIRPEGDTIRATAVFRRGVVGRVMFMQASGDPYGQLSIYVALSSGSHNISAGHNWHIHNFPLLTESESCTAAGGHLNPYNVPVNKNYSEGCRRERPLWCEAGDYASKHQPLSFLTAGPARHVFTDESTSLNGPDSIIGRSMVIHGADGASTRLACANILLQRSTEGRTTAWYGAGDAHGELWASQASDLDPTTVRYSFYGLRGLGGGFHIHLLPVGGASADPCSNPQIKGHYNPFRVEAATSPSAGNGTDDEYEVGDISGRRGSLRDQDHVTKQYSDMNLPLPGTHSILGRSLVIHYANGSRMQCAGFLQELPSDGEWVHATADFSGNISGRIFLSQVVYPDGGSGDTTILVDLHSSSSSNKTSGLQWIIHMEERRGEAYNPYDVPSQTGDGCTAMAPLLCRVGDLKGKHGPVTPGDKVLLTDPNLPLTGDFSVIGRSLGVTSDSVDLSSLILPDVPVTLLYIQRMTSFNRSAFREAVSLLLSVASWRVTMLPDSADSATRCQRVAFFIIGFNDTEALSSIHTQESLGRPCLPPPVSLDSGAGSDLTAMAASAVLASALLLLWWPL